MSLAPTIGESAWLAEKYNLGEEKNPVWANLAEKPLGEGKNSKLSVTWKT